MQPFARDQSQQYLGHHHDHHDRHHIKYQAGAHHVATADMAACIDKRVGRCPDWQRKRPTCGKDRRDEQPEIIGNARIIQRKNAPQSKPQELPAKAKTLYEDMNDADEIPF